MSDNSSGVSRSALEALGIPAAAIDPPFINAEVPKPNGKHGNGRANGKVHQAEYIALPDGAMLAAGALIPLHNNAFTDPSRTHLIVRTEHSFGIDPRGFFVVDEYMRPEQAEPGMASSKSEMKGHWSNAPELGQQTVFTRDLDSGDFLSGFDDPAYTSRTERAFIANVAKAQIRHLQASQKRVTPIFTGWSISPSGVPRFVMEDKASSLVLSAGKVVVLGPGVPPAIPAREAYEHFVRAWSEWSRDVAGVAGQAFACRSQVASIRPLGTSLKVQGETGASKTTLARSALSINGAPVGESAPLTTTFTASGPIMKSVLGPRNDMVSVIDDFHSFAQTYGLAKALDTYDGLIRAFADGCALDQRARRDGSPRPPVFLRGGGIFTSERVPGLQTSAERRVAEIYFETDVDSSDVYAQWDLLQQIAAGLGHAIHCWGLPIFASPGGREKLADIIGRMDRFFCEQIEVKLTLLRPHAPLKFVRSIARNWGPFMTGAVIADRAMGLADGEGTMTETLRHGIVGLALRQLDRLESGGAFSGMTPEWVDSAIRWAHTAGKHLKARKTDKFLDPNLVPDIADYGYRSRTVAGGIGPDKVVWEAGATHLGWLDDDGKTRLFRKAQLFDVLRDYATRPGSAVRFDVRSPDELPAALVKCGAAHPDTTPSRQGRPMQRYYIPEGKDHRIHVIVVPPMSSETVDPLDPRTHLEENIDISIVCENFLVGPRKIALDPPDLLNPMVGPVGPRSKISGPTKDSKKNECIQLVTQGGSSGSSRSTVLRSPMEEAETAAPKPAPQLVALMPPWLAGMLRNTVGPHCPVKRPQMAQDERSPARDPELPVDRNEAPAGLQKAQELPSAVASPEATPDERRSAKPTVQAPVAYRVPAEAREAKRWKPNAVAIEADSICVHAPDGIIERRPLPDELRPERACTGAVAAFAIPQRFTQVWLHPDYTAHTDVVPAKMTRKQAREGIACEFADLAGLCDGWHGPDRVTAWTRLYQTNGPELSIVIPALDTETRLREAQNASELLQILDLVREATGVSYHLHPATSFETLLRFAHENGTSLKADLSPSDFPEPMRELACSDLHWLRPLTADEKTNGRYVHAYDKNGMFLAALSSLAVGFGVPELWQYEAGRDYQSTQHKRKPGYWKAKVTTPEIYGRLLLPSSFNVLRPRRSSRKPPAYSWYTTPTLDLVVQHGGKIEVSEAWIFPNAHKVFVPVYKTLRAAYERFSTPRDHAELLAASLLKGYYAKGLNNLGSQKRLDSDEPNDFCRPDWRHHEMATTAANLIRNMVTHNLRPFAIGTDEIYLASDNPDPMVAKGTLPIGKSLKDWKHTGTAPLELLPREFLDWSGRCKPTLVALKKWMKASCNA